MKKVVVVFFGLLIAGCGTAPASPGTANPITPSPVAEEVEVAEEASDSVQATEEDTETATVVEEEPPVEEETQVAEDLQVENIEEPADAATTEVNHEALLDGVLYGQSGGADALAEIRQLNDTSFVAGLIDSLRYRRDLQDDIGFTLNELTGENLAADWFEWVEWAGNHPEIEGFESYPRWKAALFSHIDPNFLRFVYADVKVDPDSRVEEIVWGGVQVDGIPALDNPTMIDPEDADYLIPEERVFGVSINGDTRAYPARFLDWHEMFNDIVGGEPVSLAY